MAADPQSAEQAASKTEQKGVITLYWYVHDEAEQKFPLPELQQDQILLPFHMIAHELWLILQVGKISIPPDSLAPRGAQCQV